MVDICCSMGLCLSKKKEELPEASCLSSLSSLSSLSEIELFSVNANKTICEVNDEITIRIIFQDEMKKQKAMSK